MEKAKYYESDYEEAFMQVLGDNGWTTTNALELHRKETEALLESDMRQSIAARHTELTEAELTRVIANLRNTDQGRAYLTLRSVFTLYRDGYIFNRDDQTLPDMHVQYIDFDHSDKNIFRAVNQLTMIEGKENRRPDIMLYVNGIPVCIIELKNPADPDADIYKAWEQIHVRYRRDIPSLMKYCALSCISDGANSRLGTTYSPYEHYYAWKKVNNEDKAARGVAEMQTLIAGAYAPARLLSILRDFVYFPDVKEDEEKEVEVVCRYPQFFATERLFSNVLAHMRTTKSGDGKGGTYFGATGCGKTYTMLFLARQLLLRAKSRIGSPTILIIVDREDLQAQASKLFCASTDFLCDGTVREIEDREDLKKELSARGSGGIFIITIQKFCEEIGFLSDRANIICFSDEAHRTQTGTGSKLKVVTENPRTDEEKTAAFSEMKAEKNDKVGAFVTYGFAYYLRAAFPNATFVGFTGTPIDDTIHVFGNVVDMYTMRQAVEDGITVDLKYDPRLARIEIDPERVKLIEQYYKQCAEEGVDQAKIEKSKRAMASLNVILGDESRLQRLATDIINHYETFTANSPDVVQKAMIVCSERKIAYTLYRKIAALRPEWLEPKRVDDESKYTTSEELAELQTYEPLPMVNIVATRNANERDTEMYQLLGDKAHRQMLAEQFKKDQSHFKIAIVVDMWITGFDVPSLTILYNDKPLQKHTLIQTISRVNRKYPGKEFGLIVDYIGIRENMLQALKKYGGEGGTTVDDLEASYEIFAKLLEQLKKDFAKFDSTKFFENDPMQRLLTLQGASEFVLAQPASNDEKEPSFKQLFLGHVRQIKAAYDICQPAGRLSTDECAWAQFFMAVRSLVVKMTDSSVSVETMNKAVEEMVRGAIRCTGVERVLNAEGEEEIFGDEIMEELNRVKEPNTRFQLLAKLLKRAIAAYGRVNKVKEAEFLQLLQEIVKEYNTRDKLTFANNVATDTVNAVNNVVENKVNSLIDRIKKLFGRLKTDKEEFRKLGITFEEKAFYDILVEVRDKYEFEYPQEKCLVLAKKINELIAGSSVYADWLNNKNIRSELSTNLTILLYREGYPPEWDEEVFAKVMAQVENFKKYN